MDWYRSGRDGLVGHSFLSRAGYVLASFFISTLVISVVGLKMV